MDEMVLMGCIRCGGLTMAEPPEVGTLKGVICKKCVSMSQEKPEPAKEELPEDHLAEVISITSHKKFKLPEPAEFKELSPETLELLKGPFYDPKLGSPFRLEGDEE
jgi:hypothetical protein